MDLKLIRKEYRSDGIFSELISEVDGVLIAHTLEHAYEDGQGGYAPKIPMGTFTCVRGQHRLEGMTEDFTTFEITGVDGHSNLLFHSGNFNRDSSGCLLLGAAEVTSEGGIRMVTASRATFAKFMELQADVDTFNLTVVGAT